MTARLVPAAVAAALAVLSTGCGSGAHPATPAGQAGSRATAATTSPGGAQQVTIHATDGFRFEPASVTAHTGALTVTLVNDTSYPHNLSVADLHTTSETVTGGTGTNTSTFTLTFSRPGTYSFVCTFHSSAGMRGQFVIT